MIERYKRLMEDIFEVILNINIYANNVTQTNLEIQKDMRIIG